MHSLRNLISITIHVINRVKQAAHQVHVNQPDLSHPQGGVIPRETMIHIRKNTGEPAATGRNFLIKKHLWNELWKIVGADVLIVACRYNKFLLSLSLSLSLSLHFVRKEFFLFSSSRPWNYSKFRINIYEKKKKRKHFDLYDLFFFLIYIVKVIEHTRVLF